MAIDFGDGQSGRYYTIPHADALDLIAATGWTIGVWTRVEDNTGSLFQYLLGAGTVTVSPSIYLWLVEASGSPANTWVIDVRGPSGGVQAPSSTATPADGRDRLVVMTYNGSLLRMHLCTPGAAPTLAVTGTVALGDIVLPTDWQIGRRTDGNVDRHYEEHAGELFFANRAATSDEIGLIAAGAPPIAVLGAALKGWWHFLEPTATVRDVVGGNDATQFGSSWPAASNHFPLRLGMARAILSTDTSIVASYVPDAILASTNVSGAVAAVQTAGGDRLSATVPANALDVRFSFSTPS